VSALMRQKDLKRADVEAAFQVEQVERTAHHGPLVGSAALRTFGKPSPSRGDSNECPFCSIEGHAQEDCYKYKSARNDAIKLVNERKADKRGGGNKRKGKANRAKVEEEEVVEKAQRAQVRLAASPSSSADAHWIADTGATSHMTPHRSWFTSYRPHVVPICVANDAIVYSASVGDVVLTPTDAALRPCRLSRVLHVPELQNNLFAVLHLTSHHKFRVVIEGSQLQFSQQGALCLTATVKDGTAYMDVKVAAVAEAALASRAPLTRSLWHRRLVHIGEAKIEQALKHALAQGLKVDSDDPIPHICVPCVHGKQHRDPFPAKASHRSKTPFERIHSDLHEVPCLTSSGYRYWLTFIDDCSRYAWIYLLKHKSEAFDAFKLFKAMVEKQYNAVIRFFHEDKGGEYIGHKWDAFFGEHGIRREHTTRATPQQNGVAERKNRTLAEIVTAMLNEAKLPKSFWGEALATANKVLNMLPSAALPPDTTPYEIIEKRKPDYAPLRVFGCRAFAHVGKDKRKSLDSHTTPCVFLGYPEDYRGWKLWDPRAKRVIISRDVIWNEEEMPGNSTAPVPLLSVLEYADQEEASAPNPDDPVSPMEGPAAPAHPEEPVAAAAPQPKRQASAEPAEQPVTPPRAPHPFFNLKSPTPAPQTPPPQSPDTPPVRPRRAPAHRDPSPTPDPAPEAPRRSSRSNKGVALAPNFWNATDRLHGNVHGTRVESYREPSLRPTSRAPSAQPSPSPSPTPDPTAWRESSAPILSDEEEEEAAALPGSPQNPDVKSESDEENIAIDSREDLASSSARRTVLGDSAHHTPKAQALIAQGLAAVYGPSDSGEILELTDAYEAAFAVAALKANGASDAPEPKSFRQAMSGPDANKWYEAAAVEMQAHLDNGTWELVKLPAGRKAIGSKWVFKIKRNADGSIERYKARLVAQGFSQRPGIDFTETFAPTTKWAALRSIFALAAFEDLELESVDISNAYLNGELKDVEIYMKQPEGFEVKDSSWAAKLQKGLYGMKQGGHCWYEKLDQVLQSEGFRRLHSDASIFVWEDADSKVIVPVFVDDITLASKSKAKIQMLKALLAKHFKLRDLGASKQLLGVEILRNRAKGELGLTQRGYARDILARFGLSDCRPVSTPLDPGTRLDASLAPSTPAEVAFMRTVDYVGAVGALMYLAIVTRPDIAYAVGVLCRFMANPGPEHWKAAKHLLRYVAGTIDFCLLYKLDPNVPNLFCTFSNADLAGNVDTGRSTTGYVVKMGTGAVSWLSKLQSIVALSTTEAEFVAAVSAGQESIWMSQFLAELGYDTSGAAPLLMDNQSAIQVARNPEHHGRMKHLDLRYFWLRDEVVKGHLAPRYIPTAEMAADILTKALARVKVETAREQLGLFPIPKDLRA
jgi:transposase InsO family protein